ncbi:hypothetical protein LINGRAHAP2_LOCUS10513 [Linum grandiflorum]
MVPSTPQDTSNEFSPRSCVLSHCSSGAARSGSTPIGLIMKGDEIQLEGNSNSSRRESLEEAVRRSKEDKEACEEFIRLKRDALEEAFQRANAEKVAADAIKTVKALETLLSTKLKRRKVTDENLAKQKEELQNTLEEKHLLEKQMEEEEGTPLLSPLNSDETPNGDETPITSERVKFTQSNNDTPWLNCSPFVGEKVNDLNPHNEFPHAYKKQCGFSPTLPHHHTITTHRQYTLNTNPSLSPYDKKQHSTMQHTLTKTTSKGAIHLQISILPCQRQLTGTTAICPPNGRLLFRHQDPRKRSGDRSHAQKASAIWHPTH